VNYDTPEGDVVPIVIDVNNLVWLSEDPVGFNMVHSPIPLTEQWLYNFGFSTFGYRPGFIAKDYKSGHVFIDFVLTFPKAKDEHINFFTYDLDGPRYYTVKYVHNLQQLYYLLTREALPIEFLEPKVLRYESKQDD
jgi:hypothetical protein